MLNLDHKKYRRWREGHKRPFAHHKDENPLKIQESRVAISQWLIWGVQSRCVELLLHCLPFYGSPVTLGTSVGPAADLQQSG